MSSNPSPASDDPIVPIGGPGGGPGGTGGVGGVGGQPDPWGMKRVENLITALTGVLSARVVVTPLGEVSEIHVLTKSDMQPKQVVRNIESALMAQLGFKVDHRKISVAQTAEVRPIDVLEKSVVRREARKRSILFQGVEMRHARAQRVAVKVTLMVDGEEVAGEEESADAAKLRVKAAARATLTALDRVLPAGAFELEGAVIVDAFEMQFAFVGVRVVEPRGGRVLTGSCEIKDTPEQAAVLAVLDATNRWITSYW